MANFNAYSATAIPIKHIIAEKKGRGGGGGGY